MKFIDCIDCHVQYGGVGKHNNPVSSAISEIRSICDIGVDVLVSIGTGYVPDRLSIQGARHLHSAVFQIVGVLKKWPEDWDDFCRHLGEEERQNYFRSNVPLDRAPDLDAIESMPKIRSTGVRFLQNMDLQSIRRSLLSSAFFFELDEIPVVNGTLLECRGSIRCRSPNSRALIEGLISDFPHARFQTQSNETLAFVQDAVICQKCRLYRVRVQFRVDSTDQNFVLRLKFSDQFSNKISGFPNSMSWFAA